MDGCQGDGAVLVGRRPQKEGRSALAGSRRSVCPEVGGIAARPRAPRLSASMRAVSTDPHLFQPAPPHLPEISSLPHTQTPVDANPYPPTQMTDVPLLPEPQTRQ